MRNELVLSAAMLALLSAACNKLQASSSDEVQLANSESTATSETLDISDASGANAAFAAYATADAPAVAGCTATKEILGTASACGVSYNSSVKVSWSCTGPNGGTAAGQAQVDTLVTPDACPPTTVAVTQQIGLDRTRTYGAFSGELSGTSSVTWNVAPGAAVATKQVSLQLEHKVTKDGNLIRHQTVDGNKTVQLIGNNPGPADDERIADGSLDVKFLLAQKEFQGTETGLTWHRDCCYPVAGSLAFTRLNNATGESKSGSITFGPSCGEAVNADGDALELQACSEAP